MLLKIRLISSVMRSYHWEAYTSQTTTTFNSVVRLFQYVQQCSKRVSVKKIRIRRKLEDRWTLKFWNLTKMIITILFSLFLFVSLHYIILHYGRYGRIMNSIPGPPILPIIGNIHHALLSSSKEKMQLYF